MNTEFTHLLRLFIFCLMIFGSSHSSSADTFFANEDIQSSRPHGFAIQPQSAAFVALTKKFTLAQADNFINDLRANKELFKKIERFASFTPSEQIPILKEVFALEVKSMGIIAPQLVIDLEYPRAAFFEFDVNSSGPGVVYINPKRTYADNPVMSLSLLIHETRHSMQLQMAQFPSSGVTGMRGPLSSGYFNAFLAQKELEGQMSFCDFLTLNNEYEAFLFGNYVIHRIYAGRVDMLGMGTFASQFRNDGGLKIDLDHLHQSEAGNVLEEFNQLEAEQARLLGL